MVRVDEAFEVEYKYKKNTFQVLVDFEKLQEFKKNQNLSVYDVLADYKIYKDVKKGELASERLLHEIFKTEDEEKIIKEILLKGTPQIPTSYLNKLKEEKKEQVVTYIKENSRNPSTGTPYTESFLREQINKLKYNFDPHKDFKKQAEEVIEILKTKFPISIEKITIEVEIPNKYVGRFYSLKQFGTIKKEYYDNQGNIKAEIIVTLGKKDDLINKLKQLTNNEAGYFIKN